MLLKDLPVGARVRFGKYQVENEAPEPIVWQVAGISHYRDALNPNIKEHITLVPEKIIDLRGFDAKEPSNSNTDRRNYGNNNYRDSNIRQWLNKSGHPWFDKTHSVDESPTDSGMNQPTGYDRKLGFLSNFTDEELRIILDTNLRVARNTVTDGGGSETVIDKVFLLSNTEVGLANEGGIVEGSKLPLFNDNASRVRFLTQQALSNTKSSSKPSNASSGWHWWLRTPYVTLSSYVRRVNTAGSLNFSNAFDGHIGVFPALNLESGTLVSVRPDGIYECIYNYPPELSNIKISKTNIWHNDLNNIHISLDVDDEDGNGIQYKVLINDVEVIPLTNLQPSPAKLNMQVPTTHFGLGVNLLELIVVDEQNGETRFKYNITKEDRDTFIFDRKFNFKEDYITDENIEVIYGEGIALKESGTGEVLINIPTEGKSTINKIVADGGDTGVGFLVSKDGSTYQAYQDGEWSTTPNGMTKVELESITEDVWEEWFEGEAYKKSFELLIRLQSELTNPTIKGITINYTENKAPVILNAEIAPDSVHNEYATVNANVKDYEGDKVYFKTLIKRAGESEFVQVSPLTGWFERNSSSTTISQSFNHPYFNFGLNEIKVVVKDARGEEREWVGNVTYLNTNPTILITHDDTQMTAVIGDEDGDDVAYRLFINNEMIFDYVDFTQPPVTFKQFFDSTTLEFGTNNQVKLEVKDSHGGEIFKEISVFGTYRGLMFKNDNGEYFVDDQGNILTDLLFDGVLIGGQTSPTRKVTLENRNGFAIKNTKITAKDKNFVTGAWVEISETEMPFTPMDVLTIPGIISNLDTKDFYVRIQSDRTAHRGAYFYINGKADPAE